MSIKTKTIKATELKPGMEIVSWSDDKQKVVEVFPVWSVYWCDCWKTTEGQGERRKKYAAYRKQGQKKIRYDAMIGLGAEIDYPHLFMCSHAHDNKLSDVHIKVQAFNIEMMADIGHRSYNKTNEIEILVDSNDYQVQTENGNYFYRNVADVVVNWMEACNTKDAGAFHDGQYNIDVDDFTPTELLQIVLDDAYSWIVYLSDSPEGQCLVCWNKFGKQGIKPEDTAKKLTVKDMILDAVELWGRWIPQIDDADATELYNKTLEKARKGKLTRLEYLKVFNGTDIELV